MSRLLILGGLASALLGALALAGTAWVFHATSETAFCMRCHEMRLVAEQGWRHSPHVQNEAGVVAQCSDCHIPPEVGHMIWTKARDGLVDVWVHNLGEADPHRMDWEHLEERARSKIEDSSCRRCHENITPRGAAMKTIVAHRAFERMDDRKRCVDCHRTEFHGRFREQLLAEKPPRPEGG